MSKPLNTPILPRGIRSRFVEGINGLTMHVLEAGYEEKGRPCLLLLHGFPELANSWRKVMLPLAAAATTSLRRTSAATAARRAGTATTTAISARSASST